MDKVNTNINTIVKESQIPTQMGDLTRAIEATEGALSSLGDRLTPVLRQEPDKTAEKEKECIILVPLAEQIATATRRIRGIEEVIGQLRSKIEL